MHVCTICCLLIGTLQTFHHLQKILLFDGMSNNKDSVVLRGKASFIKNPKDKCKNLFLLTRQQVSIGSCENVCCQESLILTGQ